MIFSMLKRSSKASLAYVWPANFHKDKKYKIFDNNKDNNKMATQKIKEPVSSECNL